MRGDDVLVTRQCPEADLRVVVNGRFVPELPVHGEGVVRRVPGERVVLDYLSLLDEVIGDAKSRISRTALTGGIFEHSDEHAGDVLGRRRASSRRRRCRPSAAASRLRR
jgi:hypothetical protein